MTHASAAVSKNPFKPNSDSSESKNHGSGNPFASSYTIKNPFISVQDSKNPVSSKMEGLAKKLLNNPIDMTVGGRKQTSARSPRSERTDEKLKDAAIKEPSKSSHSHDPCASMTREERHRAKAKKHGMTLAEYEKKLLEKKHKRAEKEKEKGNEVSKSKSKSDAKKIASKKLDKIDLLDVTGLYGSGFHHDGPFDPCNPVRNKNSRKAPIMAFPKDSEGNSLFVGMSVPEYDSNPLFGRQADAYTDFNNITVSSKLFPNGKPRKTHSFDFDREEHLATRLETLELGSSTFLEGAPAAPSNISLSESIAQPSLERKKSVLQRLRSMKDGSNTRRMRSVSNSADTRPRYEDMTYKSASSEIGGRKSENSMFSKENSLEVDGDDDTSNIIEHIS